MNTPAYTPPATHDTWPPATPDEQSLPPAPLAGRRLVLGVTGGVAAYKAAQLVRDLGRAGAQVQVVMTEAATRFVGAVTFQALSGNPVYTDAFDARIDDNMPHIELSRQADAILVAPATADFIAKLAHGHCDDLLSTLCVARDIPLLVAPAMNRQMWQNPATQRNINQLRADGIGVLGPDAGEQACGEVGAGRMLEPLDLIEELNAFFTPKRLQGKRILLTAGPTYEAIDPVRGITNQSSGKMGYALAQACRRAGASVTLVSGPTQLPRPAGVRFIGVQSARQMLDAVTAELDLAASTISMPWPTGDRPRKPRRRSRSHPPSRRSSNRTPPWPTAPTRRRSQGRKAHRRPACPRSRWWRTPTSSPPSPAGTMPPTVWALPPRPRTWCSMPPRSACARACRCWLPTWGLPPSIRTTTPCCWWTRPDTTHCPRAARRRWPAGWWKSWRSGCRREGRAAFPKKPCGQPLWHFGPLKSC